MGIIKQNRRRQVIFYVGKRHFVHPSNFKITTTCNQPTAKNARNSPKTASVMPPEDGRLTPETRRGLQHNKVFVKVKVY
jgi:hypothetical protein